MSEPSRETLERLRDAVAGALGLHFDETRLDQLAETAERRAAEVGAPTLDAYVERIARAEAEELQVLAERLTVGETYFFRNANDLRAFVEVVVPDRLRARGADRRLRILSAGCSSGEEPYTLAMLLRDVPAVAGWATEITGVDVNRAALARAARARYGPWSLRQTSESQRARFFRAEGREYLVDDAIRAAVRFERRNLVEEDRAFWAAGSYDVVFCRNVLMYFAPETTRRVVARIAAALVPGGFLFLGHAETLRGLSADFHLHHSHDTFYYQRKDGELAAAAGEAPDRRRVARVPELTLPRDDVDWIEAVQEATRRIARLTAPAEGAGSVGPERGPAGAESQGGPATAPPPAAAQRFARALELHREERHAEALAALGAGAEVDGDADALLLRAVLLASSGDPATAERLCGRILELDALSAEAHYVKALCREHAGDRAGATDHDRYALYLDPSFAMPRLHLGLLAKRAGEPEAARRELSRAIVSLVGEDASRILLLGGGFGREALVELCRAELRACGGEP